MRVTQLALVDFRNYEQVTVGFHTGINALIGLNGQGKTNIVEAIHYLANLQSHRVNTDAALVRNGQNSAVVRILLSADKREALLELQINKSGANRAQLNKNQVPVRELPRWITSVIFSPEDLQIVKGDPANRRRFVDAVYATLFPSHRAVLSDFERVLKQRNALLRSIAASKSRESLRTSLDSWNEQFISLSEQIVHARKVAIEWLAPHFSKHYNSLVPGDHSPRISLDGLVADLHDDVSRETSLQSAQARENEYVSRETYLRLLRKSLQDGFSAEVARGVTLSGPHRDEILFEVNDLPVKGYASHGETWSFALSLKIALVELVREHSPAGDPIVILDDVLAELDSNRRRKLAEYLKNYEQVIITSAVESDLPTDMKVHKIFIASGAIAASHETPANLDATDKAHDV